MNVTLQACSGLMLATGAESDPPIGISNSWNDYVGGLHAAVAIVGALSKRRASGKGCHLDVSQFEASVAMIGSLLFASAVTQKPPSRLGSRSSSAAPQGCYRCAGEDQWCAISVQTDEQWQKLRAMLGGASRYDTLADRLAHHDAIDAAIETWTATLGPQEVERRLTEADIPAAAMRRADEVAGAEEWRHVLRPLKEHGEAGPKVIGLPFAFRDSAAREATEAPRMGATGEEALRDWLGLDEASACRVDARGGGLMARILDLTSLMGAYGTRLLAELGHDVLRIERPGGDALRREAPLLAAAGSKLEASAFHQFLNAGKRSLALDLASERGRKLLRALLGKADVLVASLPLPLPEDALLAVNPDLVLVRLDDGPPELCAYASAGLLAITGEPDGKPTMLGGHVPCAAVGVHVALAAAAALFEKEASGRGRVVEVSAPQCLASLAEQVWVEYSASGERMERLGSRGGITAVAGALPCADGHWMISVPPDPRGWANFVQLVPDPAFKDDNSLADEAMRRERKQEILDRIAHWSQQQKKNEIVEQAQALHIPAAAVTNPLELIDDRQLLARGFLKPVDHPDFGKMNFPVGALASMFGQAMSFAPSLGESTALVLDALGYSDSEIRRLKDEGIVA